MKHKIIIVIDNLGPGGTQRQIVEYLKHADRNRFKLKVINLDRGYCTLADEITALGYEIIEIAHKGFLNLATLHTLIRIFKSEKPDVVHTYLFTADCYGRLAARLAGIRIIVSSVRNVDLWKKWHHVLTDRILATTTDKITINAENIRPFLIQKEHIPDAKIATIYNGIDLKRFERLKDKTEVRTALGIPTQAFVVGMVSRFSEQKDYATFLGAAEMVTAQMQNVYFLAVGEGPLRESLQSQAETQARKARVIFTGLRRDTPELINAMDVCVLSSHYEGCPNVILEYMACAKPLISSEVGGCAELIVRDKTGFLVPPQNPSALATQMLRLLNDTGMRQEMGNAGRKRVEENFSSSAMTANTERLYHELLKPKIAYILSQFPETHETFILREFSALKDKGINFKILSLKTCKDKVVHEEAQRLIADTIYGNVYSLWPILYGLRHPVKMVATLIYTIKSYYKNPQNLIKGLFVWLECLYFTRILAQERITHIHSHWATIPTTAAVILSRLSGTAFSFTAHAWDIFINSNGLLQKINDAKFVVTCTEYNRAYLTRLATKPGQSDHRQGASTTPTSKISLNYHGIDLSRFSFRLIPAKNQKPKILAIGRLVETKGFEYLIEACKIIRERGVDFTCTIVGSGPSQEKLKALTKSYGLRANVIFMGTQPQETIRNLFAEAAVCVQPSVIARNGDRDGIPNVIIEAMAGGVPVVASSVSGIPEVVIHEQTGLLIRERDSVTLANAIMRIWMEPALRNELASNARKLVEEKFDTMKNTEALVSLFETHGVALRKS